MIKVITCRIGKSPSVDMIDDPYRYLKDDLIKGGYVEVVQLLNGVFAYCDEDGESKNMKFNRAMPSYGPGIAKHYDFYVYLCKEEPVLPGAIGLHKFRGDFVLVEQDSNFRAVNISEKNEKEYLEWLKDPLSLICRRCGRSVPTPGHIYCGAKCSSLAEARQ